MENEIGEIENVAWVQVERVDEVEGSVELHRARCVIAARAVEELRDILKGIQSEGVKQSLEIGEIVIEENDKITEDLRLEREAILQENEKLTEEVERALEKRKKAMEMVHTLDVSAGALVDDMRPQTRAMEESLATDIKRFESVLQDLNNAYECWEELEI